MEDKITSVMLTNELQKQVFLAKWATLRGLFTHITTTNKVDQMYLCDNLTMITWTNTSIMNDNGYHGDNDDDDDEDNYSYRKYDYNYNYS